MMAAISASEGRNQVILLEKNEKPGKKIFITGKGRCNLTSACDPNDFLANVVTNPRFLYSSFENFTNRDMMDWARDHGLKIKVERGERVFPVSDRAADVIDTLRRECVRRGVDIRLNSEVAEIVTRGTELTGFGGSNDETSPAAEKNDRKSEDRTAHVSGVRLKDGSMILADAVIVATGGKSYESTGSTGDGYRFAESLGHTVKTPQPSLVPFRIRESWCRDLMGLSLKNVSVKVKYKKKTLYDGFGEFLFTHFGVSGPLVLTASTRMGGKNWKLMNSGELELVLDLKPALTPDQLDKRFLREFDTWRNKNISNVMDQMLPKKLIPVFLAQCEIAPDKKVRDITKGERRSMTEKMKNLNMHIIGVRGFEEAIITRGGVNVREIDPRTMESKKVKGIYFCGEVLDVDAVTGGFNLQIAWSTGRAAGYYAGRRDRDA